MRTPLVLLAWTLSALAQIGPTAIPHGGLHVEGTRIVDEAGQIILLRGTQLPSLEAATPTTLSQIRQRWNMNAVRLPVSVSAANRDPDYLGRVAGAIKKVNQAEMIAILAATGDAEQGLPTADTEQFWKSAAAYFKTYPGIIFDAFSEPVAGDIPGHQVGIHSAADWQFWLHGGKSASGQKAVGMQVLVDAIRSTGATQVIAAMALDDDPLLQGFDRSAYVNDPNVLYEFCPMHPTNLTDAQRDQHFGFAASQVPLLANDWDLELDQASAQCQGLPADPKKTEAIVRSLLTYFDAHEISWTSSVFQPGKLITDLDTYEPTQLYRSWTCGQAYWPPPGLGQAVQFHLWGVTGASLIAVNGGSGTISLPQDGLGIGYGPGLENATSLQVVDALGASREVPLLFAGPGQINFAIPAYLPEGPLDLAVMTANGPGAIGKAVVRSITPGLFTATANARGPVKGATQDGTLLWTCDISRCQTLPVRVGAQVTLWGTGFRHASLADLRITVGGIEIPILSAGAQAWPYNDQVTIEIGPELQGLGETDLIFTAVGKVANAVRIAIE